MCWKLHINFLNPQNYLNCLNFCNVKPQCSPERIIGMRILYICILLLCC
uniref:Uncharacterized protein n=1 Tax=Macaca fascicularis TaxID=9541 RepID=A0A7N9CMX8_MACFA